MGLQAFRNELDQAAQSMGLASVSVAGVTFAAEKNSLQTTARTAVAAVAGVGLFDAVIELAGPNFAHLSLFDLVDCIVELNQKIDRVAHIPEYFQTFCDHISHMTEMLGGGGSAGDLAHVTDVAGHVADSAHVADVVMGIATLGLSFLFKQVASSAVDKYVKGERQAKQRQLEQSARILTTRYAYQSLRTGILDANHSLQDLVPPAVVLLNAGHGLRHLA